MDELFDFTKLSPDDDDSTDEEAEQAQREATLQRQKEELEKNEATIKRRREAREQFEEGRFEKATKVENETFEEVLVRKAILLGPEEKSDFKAFIPNLVEFFDRGEGDFRERMEEKTHAMTLFHFINKLYQEMVKQGDTPENLEMHEFLVKFHKEVFDALREMTSIPKDVVFQSVLHGNVFREAKEKALKEAACRWGHVAFQDKLREAQEKAKQEEMIMEQLVEQMRTTTLLPAIDKELASLLAGLSMEDMSMEPRDTSPTRHRLTPEAHELAEKAVAHLKVNEETRYGARREERVESDEEDFGSFLMGQMSVLQEPEPERELVNKIKEEPEDYQSENEEELEEFHSDEELEMGGDWRTLWREENPLYFGRKPSREDEEDWRRQRFEDKHQERRMVKLNEKKGVKFAPFSSPLNTMRIFVKPHGHFFLSGDDGPRTDHVDLRLKDGWKAIIRKNEIGPLIVPGSGKMDGFRFCGTKNAQKVTNDLYEYMNGYHGNLLGRFWFNRDAKYDEALAAARNREDRVVIEEPAEEHHRNRRDMGLLRQYTREELELLYMKDLEEIHRRMRRGFYRKAQKDHLRDRWSFRDEIRMVSRGEVAQVLILTDWRLAHLNKLALLNACFKFMPTNMGAAFFDSMSEYLNELLLSPNVEIGTIIFAFGGSPRFKKEHFLSFFKRLSVQTLKRVDVFWTAQDWWDGLRPNEQQKRELDEFNAYVKRLFETMRKTGHINYKWFDVREERVRSMKPPLPVLPDIHAVSSPEEVCHRTLLLEPIYSAYLDLFVSKCNCFASSQFWMTRNRPYDRYSENEGFYPSIADRGSILAVPYKAK